MARIAVVIPCHNEAVTIGKVVADFRAALPEAEIHVFDNVSTDDTSRIALDAGATVHAVGHRGKGHVVRAMFRAVDADVLLMVDGDDTYPAEHARALLAPVLEGKADMVVGCRLKSHSKQAFRRMHGLGNRLVREVLSRLFGVRLADVLSGCRAFGRRFVEAMPVLLHGFEIETELTVFALAHGFDYREVDIPYGEPSSSCTRTTCHFASSAQSP